MIQIKINNQNYKTSEEKTILEAALENDVYIPNLCYHKDLKPEGACRLCIVKINNRNGLIPACATKVKADMSVITHDDEIIQKRRNILWLILSEYPFKIDKKSELYEVVNHIGAKQWMKQFSSIYKNFNVIKDQPLFIRDLNKCIFCNRCIRVCQDLRGIYAIGAVNRGWLSIVNTPYQKTLKDADCKFCTACVEVCPTGALEDKVEFDDHDKKEKLIPCSAVCPAGIDVPEYIELIAEKKYQQSLEVIREKVPFPHILGIVCPHPCEGECRRKGVNEAISIRELKRFVAEKDNERWKKKIKKSKKTGKKVIVVGSGPTGLTSAYYLSCLGHDVEIYEALSKPGGMLIAGIPRFRLPENIVMKEINHIVEQGVKIKPNSRIDSLYELLNKNPDAILLAMGATIGAAMNIAGEFEERKSVFDGIKLLEKINFGEDVSLGNHVVVVGGGNVAIDVARSAVRLGVEHVHILYRRTREEMPAFKEEIELALEEGVQINYLTAPISILGEDERLVVKCSKMKLGLPDESGRRRPMRIKGSEFNIIVDSLISAVGQKPDLAPDFDIKKNESGYILVDENFKTSQNTVFAAGDVVTGPSTVIECIQQGRDAASKIDEFLGGGGDIIQNFVEREKKNPFMGSEKKFAYKKRLKGEYIPLQARIDNFIQVEQTLTEDKALLEARRCLKCHYRFDL